MRTGASAPGRGSPSSSPAPARTCSSRSCSSRRLRVGSGGYRSAARCRRTRRSSHGVRSEQPGGRDGPQVRRPDPERRTASASAPSDEVPRVIEKSRRQPGRRRRGAGRHAAPRWASVRPQGAGALSIPQATSRSLRLTAVSRRRSAPGSRASSREGRKEISSPVGIVEVSSKPSTWTAMYLWVLGLISLSLALLNLLPLLPLDGGPHRVLDRRGPARPRGRPRGLRAGLGDRDRARADAVLHRALERHRRAWSG